MLTKKEKAELELQRPAALQFVQHFAAVVDLVVLDPVEGDGRMQGGLGDVEGLDELKTHASSLLV